jgi:hypothetical protein
MILRPNGPDLLRTCMILTLHLPATAQKLFNLQACEKRLTITSGLGHDGFIGGRGLPNSGAI